MFCCSTRKCRRCSAPHFEHPAPSAWAPLEVGAKACGLRNAAPAPTWDWKSCRPSCPAWCGHDMGRPRRDLGCLRRWLARSAVDDTRGTTTNVHQKRRWGHHTSTRTDSLAGRRSPRSFVPPPISSGQTRCSECGVHCARGGWLGWAGRGALRGTPPRRGEGLPWRPGTLPRRASCAGRCRAALLRRCPPTQTPTGVLSLWC